VSASAVAVPAPPPVAPAALDAWRRDRRFFTGMAVAALLTVFAGFAPSYYMRVVFGRPTVSGAALSPLLHLHGFLFSAWIVLFVVQTRLIAGRRLALHRRLGVAGAVLAMATIAVGFSAAVDAARRGAAPPGVPPLSFLAIPVADLVVFAAFVATGLALRRRPDVHRRLMLMATVSILTPAVARLPGILAAGPLAFFALTDLFVVACLIYDRFTRGRVHPAFWWGGAFLLASQVGRLAVSGTGAWLSVAAWLTR